ncbi:hypothetical protein GYH30_003528 [Glycine max]|uniref:Uncharacterized protein n=1 Tax=Glycine max TaxID=3847 RepID=A0A0R0KU26_SOYBN|nr:hypothetical protein GYH30_003528 [Glycine max]
MHFPDSATHQKVSNLLALFHPKTLIQKNIFDGTNKELTSNLPVLLRFYNLEQHCPHGHACIAEPWRLLSVDSAEILKRVKDEYLVGGNGVVCLGGFRNVRAVHEWKALKLELDECIILCSISCL